MSVSNVNNLEDLYEWLDEIPLSRPKRNLYRDFSDGGNYTCWYYTDNNFLNCIWYLYVL